MTCRGRRPLPHIRGVPPRLRRTLLSIVLWLALSLITTSQGVLTYLATGGSVNVGALVLLNLALWLPWAALTPLIFAAARRLPLARLKVLEG